MFDKKKHRGRRGKRNGHSGAAKKGLLATLSLGTLIGAITLKKRNGH